MDTYINYNRYFFLGIMCISISCNYSSSNKDSKDDYFEVTNELTPIIYDSVLAKSSFLINAIYCGPRVENRTVSVSGTVINPLRVSNIKISKNTDPPYPSDLYWIHILNENTIQINYGLYCLPRIIYRGKPPPDTRPRPFMNISFDCAVMNWQQLAMRPYTQSYKSSTKTVYTTMYPFVPQNTSHQIIKWQYRSIVKVFKNGHLYREYEVSEKIPDISKVHSYVSQKEPLLVVEILE